MNPCKDCFVEPIARSLNVSIPWDARAAWLDVSGMGCEHCVTRARNALFMLKGVLRADLELEDELVVVAYNPQETSPGDLLKAIRGAANNGKHTYYATIKTIKPAGETWYQEQQLILRH